MKRSIRLAATYAANIGNIIWASALIVVVSFSLVVSGCKKATPGGETAKLLPAGVSKQLSPDALAIVDALTDKTELFGFVDLGQPLPKLATSWGADQAMIDELLKLLDTRAGLQLRKLQVVGLAKFTAKDPVFFFPGAAGNADKTDLGFTQQYNGAKIQVIDEVFATNFGTMLALGTEQAIKGFLDERAAKGPSLTKANAKWVTHALTLAADNCLMISVRGDMKEMQEDAKEDSDAAAILGKLETATMLVSGSGLRYEFQAKAGQGEALGSVLKTWLDKGRAELQALATKAASDQAPGAALHGKIIHTYGMHFFDSIEHSVAGDDVSFRLPWRAPPDFAVAAAPALAQRISSPGEWAVAQVNIGGPLLPTLLRYTDLIGKPMELATVEAEIKAFLMAQIGLDFTQTQAVTLSVSGDVPLISVVNAGATDGAATGPQRQLDKLSLIPMAWGTAITTADHPDVLRAAVAAKPGTTPLVSHELLKDAADATTLFKGAVDLSAAPGALREQLGDKVPVQAVYARASTKGLDVELQAMPGKAPAIQALVGLGLGAMQDQARKLYEQRQTAPLPQALAGVIAHYQAQSLATMLKPKDLGNDRLLFSMPMPVTSGAAKAQIGVAAIGIIAAVAIPSFMKYMERSKQSEAMVEARAAEIEAKVRAIEEGTTGAQPPQIATP